MAFQDFVTFYLQFNPYNQLALNDQISLYIQRMEEGTHEDMPASEGSTVQQEQICRASQLLLGAQGPHHMPLGGFNLRLAVGCLLTQCAFTARLCLRCTSFGLGSSEGNPVCSPETSAMGTQTQEREILGK